MSEGNDSSEGPRRRGWRKPHTRLVIARVSPEEKQAIDAIRERTGLSAGALVRYGLLNIPPPRASRRPRVELKAVAQILGQYGKIGGNINQMAKPFNMERFFEETRECIQYAVRDMMEIRFVLLETLGFENGHDPEPEPDESHLND